MEKQMCLKIILLLYLTCQVNLTWTPMAPGAWTAALALCGAKCAPYLAGSPIGYTGCITACWAWLGPLTGIACFA
jgi:hypothetical protein